MSNLVLFIPAIFIVVSSFLAVKAVKHGTQKKKALALQVFGTIFVMAMCALMPVKAETAPAAEQTAASSSQTSSESKAGAYGVGLIAAALATGLACIGGGLAVASAAPAAIAATSEDSKAFGKALIFVALGEGFGVYGLLISIMILNQLGNLL